MEGFLQRGQLTDITLIAGKCLFYVILHWHLTFSFNLIILRSPGNKRVVAHRLVLSATSEYFAAMFTQNLREANQREVEMHNVDGDALVALVRYCYTGMYHIPNSDMASNIKP